MPGPVVRVVLSEPQLRALLAGARIRSPVNEKLELELQLSPLIGLAMIRAAIEEATKEAEDVAR